MGRVFIRNEVHVEEDAGGLEVSCMLLGWLMLLIWAPFSGFLLANHLACCPYLIWLRAFPNVHTHLSANLDSKVKVLGRLAKYIMGWQPLPFLTSRDLFCVSVVLEVSLIPRKNVPSLSLLKQRSLSWSTNRRQIPAAQHGAHLSPVSGPDLTISSILRIQTIHFVFQKIFIFLFR